MRKANNPIAKWLLGPLITACVLLAACSGGQEPNDGSDEAPAPDRTEVTTQIADEVIVPGYEKLAAATSALAGETSALCAAESESQLDTARDSWRDAQAAWMATAAYRIGSIALTRSEANISFRADAQKVAGLSAEAPDTEPVTTEALEDRGADVRGLEAIEMLLFAPATATDLSLRDCTYAAAASDLVAGATDALARAWTEGVDGDKSFADQVAGPGDDSAWDDPTDFLTDLLNGSLSALTNVADRQLGVATGSTSGDPDPQAADPGPAHNALADMIEQVRSVGAVYGQSTSQPPTGLSALVTGAATNNSDEAIRTDLTGAVESLERVPPPLSATDPSEPDSAPMEDLREAEQHVMAVRSALSTEVASLLGLTVSFSDSDGDG